ncbi:hypothetical protein EIN_418590 [Entamoeba invadens IP1]|uniref:Uncharacterized protein n=1 Tax=Entamoeba invadens IP1 TaxID=370355 RepID=A0A0A1U7L8_ENTIV|nr:hypothetical protein EIN_418590 [Entamoeba invadens IP1]ELP87980.1 hypothetical protein EIN_418590 [Entamoeba invadens IP1]|eukprot:XP_004254751.1 hypothetical protein EIN_418590 [Entamoeba invadens IP1]
MFNKRFHFRLRSKETRLSVPNTLTYSLKGLDITVTSERRVPQVSSSISQDIELTNSSTESNQNSIDEHKKQMATTVSVKFSSLEICDDVKPIFKLAGDAPFDMSMVVEQSLLTFHICHPLLVFIPKDVNKLHEYWSKVIQYFSQYFTSQPKTIFTIKYSISLGTLILEDNQSKGDLVFEGNLNGLVYVGSDHKHPLETLELELHNFHISSSKNEVLNRTNLTLKVTKTIGRKQFDENYQVDFTTKPIQLKIGAFECFLMSHIFDQLSTDIQHYFFNKPLPFPQHTSKVFTPTDAVQQTINLPVMSAPTLKKYHVIIPAITVILSSDVKNFLISVDTIHMSGKTSSMTVDFDFLLQSFNADKQKFENVIDKTKIKCAWINTSCRVITKKAFNVNITPHFLISLFSLSKMVRDVKPKNFDITTIITPQRTPLPIIKGFVVSNCSGCTIEFVVKDRKIFAENGQDVELPEGQDVVMKIEGFNSASFTIGGVKRVLELTSHDTGKPLGYVTLERVSNRQLKIVSPISVFNTTSQRIVVYFSTPSIKNFLVKKLRPEETLFLQPFFARTYFSVACAPEGEVPQENKICTFHIPTEDDTIHPEWEQSITKLYGKAPVDIIMMSPKLGLPTKTLEGKYVRTVTFVVQHPYVFKSKLPITLVLELDDINKNKLEIPPFGKTTYAHNNQRLSGILRMTENTVENFDMDKAGLYVNSQPFYLFPSNLRGKKVIFKSPSHISEMNISFVEYENAPTEVVFFVNYFVRNYTLLPLAVNDIKIPTDGAVVPITIPKVMNQKEAKAVKKLQDENVEKNVRKRKRTQPTPRKTPENSESSDDDISSDIDKEVEIGHLSLRSENYLMISKQVVLCFDKIGEVTLGTPPIDFVYNTIADDTHGIKVCVVKQKYVVQNLMVHRMKFYCAQFPSGTVVLPKSYVPCNVSGKLKISATVVVNEEEYQSEDFSIYKAMNCQMILTGKDEKYIFVNISVTVVNKEFTISFDGVQKPSLCVQNFTSFPITFAQVNTIHTYTIQPNKSFPFAWTNPTLKHLIQMHDKENTLINPLISSTQHTLQMFNSLKKKHEYAYSSFALNKGTTYINFNTVSLYDPKIDSLPLYDFSLAVPSFGVSVLVNSMEFLHFSVFNVQTKVVQTFLHTHLECSVDYFQADCQDVTLLESKPVIISPSPSSWVSDSKQNYFHLGCKLLRMGVGEILNYSLHVVEITTALQTTEIQIDPSFLVRALEVYNIYKSVYSTIETEKKKKDGTSEVVQETFFLHIERFVCNSLAFHVTINPSAVKPPPLSESATTLHHLTQMNAVKNVPIVVHRFHSKPVETSFKDFARVIIEYFSKEINFKSIKQQWASGIVGLNNIRLSYEVVDYKTFERYTIPIDLFTDVEKKLPDEFKNSLEKTFYKSIDLGVDALNDGFVSGIKGLWSTPSTMYQMAKEKSVLLGPLGFVGGIFAGVAGVVVKPIDGVVGFVQNVGMGISGESCGFIAEDRVRFPWYVAGGDYNEKDAVGWSFLVECNKGRYHTAKYIDCVFKQREKGIDTLVVTETALFVISKNYGSRPVCTFTTFLSSFIGIVSHPTLLKIFYKLRGVQNSFDLVGWTTVEANALRSIIENSKGLIAGLDVENVLLPPSYH